MAARREAGARARQATPNQGHTDRPVATPVTGVDDEIALLRTLIRRAADSGDIEAARRGMESLARLIKTRKDLGPPSSPLGSALLKVLQTLADEEPR